MKKLLTLFSVGKITAYTVLAALVISGGVLAAQTTPIESKSDTHSLNVNAESVKQCMIKLPETIELQGLPEPLKKLKDRFVDHESAQKGMGFSQNYQNAACLATIYMYNLDLEKINRPILEADFVRNLQEISYVFKEIHKKSLFNFHSYEIPLLNTTYFANVAFTSSTTEALIEGEYNNYILKGRATCHRILGTKKDINANIALKHLDELLKASAKSLDSCLK